MTSFNLLDVYTLSKEPGASVWKTVVFKLLSEQIATYQRYYLTTQSNNFLFITVKASCGALPFSKSCDKEPYFIRNLSTFSLKLRIITLRHCLLFPSAVFWNYVSCTSTHL